MGSSNVSVCMEADGGKSIGRYSQQLDVLAWHHNLVSQLLSKVRKEYKEQHKHTHCITFADLSL